MYHSNPSGLCQCGCGRLAPISSFTSSTQGYRRGEPRRFVKGHRPRRTGLHEGVDYTVEQRGHDTPCWIWLRYVDRNGYASLGGKWAHRVSYQFRRGEIPDGLIIDHLCRVPTCVNPDHLEPVTPAENARRGQMGKKLNPAAARRILHDNRTGVAIAAEYGVTPTIVSRIKSGKVWARATGAASCRNARNTS